MDHPPTPHFSRRANSRQATVPIETLLRPNN